LVQPALFPIANLLAMSIPDKIPVKQGKATPLAAPLDHVSVQV
jgi:hypothetical protein